MRAERRFTEETIEALRLEIAEADGNEVFAVGNLDGEGRVRSLRVLARGHSASVLALTDSFETADVLIHNHPSGHLAPSENDLAIASRSAENGVGSFIVDNEVSRVYVVAEPVPKRERVGLDIERILASIQSGGAIAKRLSYYEPRPSQVELMRLLARSFNEDALAVAEAGTGVGKSFAYLVPALAWTCGNEERVVLSTATINLQQQLFEKDIPLVCSTMQNPPKAVLVKGRGNFLCQRRLQDALRDQELFDDREELTRIAEWADTSPTGCRSDLSFLPNEALWSRICSEADICLGMRCGRRDTCFVQRLRKEAASARILVVNHHLLFADLAARLEGAGWENTVVLPPYERVILDEAHTIEGAATSFFTEDFGRLSSYRQLSRLYTRRRGLPSGLVMSLVHLAQGLTAEEQSTRLDDIAEAVDQVRIAFESADTAGLELLGDNLAWRLGTPCKGSLRAILLEPLNELRLRIARLCGLVRDLVETIDEELSEEESAPWETKALLRRLEGIGSVALRFTEFEEHQDEIFWLEKKRSSKGELWVHFNATPLDVAPAVREALFEPARSVACLSATLTVADSFAFWLERSGAGGVASKPLLCERFPSPFPYETSVLLASPVDAPLPEEEGYQDFVDAAVSRLALISGGSALVLFTSYEALKSAWSHAAPLLEAKGITVLKQGEDDRARLLKRFLEDESSVLFATDSFWEGVDAPGDTLRLVILCRLPFRSPSDPVFEARREALERRGGNAFMQLSLPEAVMKFKQGFGRLMRRSTDYGAVVVLDGRLLRKRYGEIFVRSLPKTRQCFADFETVVESVGRFLEGGER